MEIRKGQAGIEFMVIVSFVILIFLAISIVIYNILSESHIYKVWLDMKRVGNTVADNINTIATNGDGYYKCMTIPDKIVGGYKYNLTFFRDTSVVILSSEGPVPQYVTTIVTTNLRCTISGICNESNENFTLMKINQTQKVWIENKRGTIYIEDLSNHTEECE